MGSSPLRLSAPRTFQAPLGVPAGFWRAHRKPRAYLARSQSHKYRAKPAICGCLVTPLPGGPGPPSVPTKRDCPQGLDAARTKGGESCPDRGPGSGPVRARKLRPRGQKSRDGAPSGERASQSAPTPPGVGLMVAPLSAPSPRHCAEGQKKCPAKAGEDDGVPGAAQITRARTRALLEYGRRSLAV